MKIKSKPVEVLAVWIDGKRKIYPSKQVARKKIAWRILYDTGRLSKGDFNTFFDNSPKSTWANKHFECECGGSSVNIASHNSTYAGEIDGYDSSGCQLHNRFNGYYKRLHERIVRWLAAGYMAKDSGLQEDLK